MRQTCLDMVYQLARKDERIFFVGSDLGVGVLDDFKRDMPDRFFMEGVSEANVVGMSAGLAMEGKIVYANTIATFFTRRAYEQVAVDLCMHNANVRLIGNGGGLVYAPLGPTHLAIEDLATFRALPNMTILHPADAVEMKRLMPETVDWPGPIYIRLARGHDPVVTTQGEDEPFVIGRAVPMRQGKDVLLIDTGICLRVSLAAAELLADRGIECTILHLPTVKPLDTEALLDGLNNIPVAVTIEEGSVVGGLGGAVAELIAERCQPRRPRFARVGLPDEFPRKYGNQAQLMDYYRICPQAVVEQVMKLREAR